MSNIRQSVRHLAGRFALLGILMCANFALAQSGLRYQSQITVGGLPNPTVRVCTEPASGSPCSPLASIFSDAALTVPLVDPFTGDVNGNYFFYASPISKYHVQIFQNGVLIFEQSDISLASSSIPGCSSPITGQLNCTGTPGLVAQHGISSGPMTTAQMIAMTVPAGTIVTSSDPLNGTDCNSGGGNGIIFPPHACYWNGFNWSILGSSGSIANCTVANSAAVYPAAGQSIACVNGVTIVLGSESSQSWNDNVSVANAGPTSMKLASVGGLPSIGFNGPLSPIETAANVGVPNGVAGLDGSAVVPLNQMVTSVTGCDGTTVILGNRTCGSAGASTLPSTPTNQVIAGPSAYGAASATAAARALVPQDLPAAATQCVLDNAICGGAVDANGNPNFLATGTSSAVPVNGGTTPLVMFIAGKYQVLNSNITFASSSGTGISFVYATQDVANTNMVAADFGSTNIPPVYSKVAPTKVTSGTTNPQLWFDLSTNTMKANTGGTGGSFVASPVIVLGAFDTTGGSAVDQVLCEPFRLDPNTRYRIFKDGGDGSQIVAGTVNKQGEFHYSGFEMTSGTYTDGQVSPYSSVIFSQNVVIMLSGTTIGGTGQGLAGAGTSVNNGPAGGVGGFGGGGGGGGGGTGKTGGAGGGRTPLYSLSTSAGGAAGGAAGANNGTAGNNGNAGTNVPAFGPFYIPGCIGAPGGGGGGDATNAGGAGSQAGGYFHLIAPAVLIVGTAKIQADGGTPATPGAGNVGGGGGGGGGCAIVQAGYVNGTTANVTANGGSGGTHAGTTVGDGGAGGTGLVKIQSIL